MIRLFPRHIHRKATVLDGIWKFKLDAAQIGCTEEWYKEFPSDAVEAVVPSCWNNEFGLYDYEGVAWYATEFSSESEIIKLAFHAVTGQAEVYVDGIHLGGHYGGFTGFDFTVENLQKGLHSLVVRVDNTHGSNTIPLARVDWFHYGGIYRSVELFELDLAWVNSLRVDYTLDLIEKSAAVTVTSAISAQGGYKEDVTVCAYLDNTLIASQTAVFPYGDVTLNCGSLENLKLWDVNTPELYRVTVKIFKADGSLLDDMSERIGFRSIKAEKSKIYLNGRELYLKGVNRHEDHPDWGFAMPFKLMKKDIDIIKNMGCNTIRCSHYPNSETFLDYCDQCGILIWEEIPMWGFPAEAIKNPEIKSRGLQMHEEMVLRDINHPSIIIWGLHNEIDTRIQEAFTLTQAFAEKIKSLDNTRLLTYATMYPMEDIALSLVDIISVNKYLGWYEGDLDKWNQFLPEFKDRLAALQLSEKPIILSEFGAGALYGNSTFEAPKWTENYQSHYFEYTLKLFHETEGVVGSYVWQYCDIRTAKELEMSRPRSFNNKGLVNEYRNPKQAYWKVKEFYDSIL